MKAFVTGGAGFIGSNLVSYLCDKGHSVTVLDNFSSSGRTSIDKRAKLVHGSIGDEVLLNKLIKGKDVVFHLAATGILKSSLENPRLHFENNFMNGVKILNVMRRHGVKKIVYSSSAAVYGDPRQSLIKESDVKHPTNPYGAAKYGFENVLSSYYHSYGIESVSLRYFNVYGPGDEQRPATRAVPNWIKSILRNEPIVLYWGGKQIKDYVFVEDVARANLMAAEKGQGCLVYNIGSGVGRKMIDVAKILGNVFEKKIEIKKMGNRIGDSGKLTADISLIKKDLGWEPKISFEDGLKRAIEYYARQLGEKKA